MSVFRCGREQTALRGVAAIEDSTAEEKRFGKRLPKGFMREHTFVACGAAIG